MGVDFTQDAQEEDGKTIGGRGDGAFPTFMVGAVSERVQLPDKIINEIHWGENDIRVIFPGGGQVNFEYKDGNYYFEGID